MRSASGFLKDSTTCPSRGRRLVALSRHPLARPGEVQLDAALCHLVLQLLHELIDDAHDDRLGEVAELDERVEAVPELGVNVRLSAVHLGSLPRSPNPSGLRPPLTHPRWS